MDVRFINPFILAIQNVFETMVESEILVSKPFLKSDQHNLASDISAVIGLSGDVLGNVVLSFPESTAVRAASKFTGMAITADDPDFADALGELLNMIAGGAKANFRGLNASISLPRVIRGKQLDVLRSKHSKTLVLPCDSQLGRFRLEATIVMAVDKAAG